MDTEKNNSTQRVFKFLRQSLKEPAVHSPLRRRICRQWQTYTRQPGYSATAYRSARLCRIGHAALEVQPGFDVYHFNDLSTDHTEELKRIASNFPEKKIFITEFDANEFASRFCEGLGATDRAVLLLDPYSTQLDWKSLEFVTQSQKVDLWLLFPISVILRMTPRDGERVRPEWKDTLDRLLGDSGWEIALYKPVQPPPMDDLFGTTLPERTERVNSLELERWVTGRLKQLFPFVANPVLLKNNGSPLFLFYLAVSNPEKRAWGLAQKAAKHIIDRFDDR